MPEILNISHLGYGGRYPRNTLLSIRKAAEVGADFVEIDVHITKDRHLVLLHERDFSEYYLGAGIPAKMTLSEVKEIDAGTKFSKKYSSEKVPTLEQAIDCIQGFRANLCIEFKVTEDNDPAEIADIAHRILDGKSFWVRFVVNSSKKEMDRRYRILPDLSLRADGVEYRYREITENVLYEFHRNCLSVWVYTVDEPKEIKRMVDLGVNGILSNYPDIIMELMIGSSPEDIRLRGEF